MQATIELTGGRRFALTVIVMLATLMQVLDSTIANVALPHMQASLGAAPDTISWVLTSYIIAAAVATPTTGWLEARIGRFALISLSLGGFTLASVMCGLATSLQMMVAARLLQGLCGAFISPLAQAIMLDIYPSDQRAKALTIWSMGVMIGPILGPVIGGVITDAYDWRWVFFVNLPVGILALVGVIALLPRIKIRSTPFDMIGFSLLAVGLAAMQLLLDRGTQLDWFKSTEIIVECLICIAMFWMFAVHTATAPSALIPRALFRDRNFVLANLFLLVVLGVLFASSALLPPFVQALLNYGTTDAGMLMVPRGLGMMASMFIAGRIANKVDGRVPVILGMVMIGSGQWMMTGFSLDMGSRLIITTGILQGLGFGFVLMPLNLIAFSTISAEHRTNAAAVWNLSRNIGGSVAIALFSALYAHNIQVSHADIAGNLSVMRFPYLATGLAEGMGVSSDAALRLIDNEVNRQAYMIAYLDDFWLMAVLTFAMIPIALLLKERKGTPADDLPVME